ncbi:MAG: FadR family transcriptional regulator [Deinococcota bacterium]|nr:FadR family transcriptional regulator [Deinococcota bacterium]
MRDIARSRLSGEVVKHLSNAIHEGRFLPGERLTSERALSEELGISRPILREALQVLETQGLVITHHGRGTFITNASTELLNADPTRWLTRNQRRVREFYEARLVIEPECAALASQRAKPEHIADLQNIISRAEKVIQQGEVVAFIGLDIDFHRMVAKMAGNALLYKMLDTVINPDTDLRKVLHRLPGHPSLAHDRHVRILSAIKKRKPKEARHEMTSALEGALQDISSFLKREVDR